MQARTVCEMEYKTKVCQHCGKEYQPTNNRQKYCKECGPTSVAESHSIYTAKWNRAHPERVKQSGARWREANPEKYKVSSRACSARYRKTSLEKEKTRNAKYQKANPEKGAVKISKRRAAKYANTPIGEMLMSTEWLAVLAEASGHCHYCDKEAKLTLDHIIPLSKGGKHSKDNVAAACRHCNCSKGNKTLEEWLAQVAQ